MSTRSVYVCYDIADPKRLRRVAKTADEAGVRVQKSVFECSLNPDELLALRQRMCLCLDPAQDSLLYQPVCPACRLGTRWQGKQAEASAQPYWVV